MEKSIKFMMQGLKSICCEYSHHDDDGNLIGCDYECPFRLHGSCAFPETPLDWDEEDE